MIVILVMGVFWIVYGIAGLLGFQVLPEAYKGKDWSRSYIRFRGISWLMVGVPWLSVYLIFRDMIIDRRTVCIILVLCALPSFIYSIIKERQYRAFLDK